MLHNDKDCVDQGIGEVGLLLLLSERWPHPTLTLTKVRLLTLLSERDPLDTVPIVRLLDYFYYKVPSLSIAPRRAPSRSEGWG